MVLLAKTKLNTINALISKALVDSNITHDKFVSVNNVLKDNVLKKKSNRETVPFPAVKNGDLLKSKKLTDY